MPKVKVLHIITRLDHGGSALAVLSLILGLNKERFDVSLMSGEINCLYSEKSDFIAKEKIGYICIPELTRNISLLKDIAAFYKIYRFIKKNGFDIVHTHTSKAGMLGRWAAKLAGVKIVIYTPHGHLFYGYFNRFNSQLIIYLERLTAFITDRIITLTQKGKEEHCKYRIAKPDKFVPIYTGIDTGEFVSIKGDKLKEKHNLNIPLESPVIGSVTRLEPVKGNKYFIASLPGVVKIFPALKVIIVGDGVEREALQLQAKKLGIWENIIFLGFCKEIAHLVNIFDIFVLSSLNEGMGRSLVEAEALGVPVVATKVGGIPEVVKDGITGILVSARDPEAMAQAIIELLQDKPLREKMSQEAKKWVDYKFTVEAMVKKISDLYEELLSR